MEDEFSSETIEKARQLTRTQVYDEIVRAFEESYTWLGRQFAEEFLLSVASWNIEHYNKDLPDKQRIPFRVRRHLLLFWEPGFAKSSLLIKGRSLLGSELCGSLSDITPAAIRGSVDGGKFRVPICKKNQYTICSEFGQLTNNSSDSSELIQKLLNILEEGRVNVCLVKAGQLLQSEREKAAEDYGIRFDDNNNFEYETEWVLMAGTYNKKFLKDNALESRFNILVPEQRFDAEFTRFVCNAPSFHVEPEYKLALRSVIVQKSEIKPMRKLPDEIHKFGLNMRDLSHIQSRLLCLEWWGKIVSDEEIIEHAEKMKENQKGVWKSPDDKVFDCVFMNPKTLQEVMDETGLPIRQVFLSLKRNNMAVRVVEDNKDKFVIS